MDAIILAGGLGTRLQSVVSDVPKPLALINEKPFLDILLNQLAGFGLIKNVVLAVCHRADQIVSRYKPIQYPFDIEFSVEDEPLGTGGGIKKAMRLTRSENVLIMNGDSYIDFSLEELVEKNVSDNALLTLVLRKVEDASRYGTVGFDISTQTILSFEEKKPEKKNGLIYGGVTLARSDLFKSIPLQNSAFSFEKDVLPVLLNLNQRLKGVVSSGRFIDIGTPESYQDAQTYLEKI